MTSRKYAYHYGAKAERTIMYELEKHGWICFRTAGSGKHGEIDVICIKNGRTILLDVKVRRTINYVAYENEHLQLLKQYYEKYKVDVYLVAKLKYLPKYHFLHIKDVQISSGSMTTLNDRDFRERGIPIDRFILMY